MTLKCFLSYLYPVLIVYHVSLTLCTLCNGDNDNQIFLDNTSIFNVTKNSGNAANCFLYEKEDNVW